MAKIEVGVQPQFDWAKWIAVLFIIGTGLAANFYYHSQPWPLRLILGIILAVLAIGLILQTAQGMQLLSFSRESQIELKKVIWPTRQETINTTLIIGAVVVVIALFLWCIDGFLLWAIGWLTGQRG